MSKAYVIKNKEGKYFKQDVDNGYVSFTDNILSCELYAKRIGAESTRNFIFRNAYKFNIEDLEVVEITIEEVNQNLIPTNYDNLSIEDKLKYREIQVRIALDRDVEYDNKITELEFTVKRLEEELAKKDKMVDIACSKLVDFEYEQKESVHSAQFWKERLEALAKQELEKEEL